MYSPGRSCSSLPRTIRVSGMVALAVVCASECWASIFAPGAAVGVRVSCVLAKLRSVRLYIDPGSECSRSERPWHHRIFRNVVPLPMSCCIDNAVLCNSAPVPASCRACLCCYTCLYLRRSHPPAEKPRPAHVPLSNTPNTLSTRLLSTRMV